MYARRSQRMRELKPFQVLRLGLDVGVRRGQSDEGYAQGGAIFQLTLYDTVGTQPVGVSISLLFGDIGGHMGDIQGGGVH